MRILVTGGSGHLGQALSARLRQRGHQLRVLSRQTGASPDIEWIVGDLATGDGLAKAVSQVDVVIHAATSSPIAQRGAFRPIDMFRSPTDVDVSGTEALLKLAEQNRVGHFVHISIVGLEETRRLPYSRVKLAAEDAVQRSRVPWTIVRATSFFWLLQRLCANMAKGRFVAVPANVHSQPVDSDDFASWVVECALDSRRGRREDYAGPQVLSFRELLQEYLVAYGLQRRIWNLPLPSAVRTAMERGQTAPAARRGATTWKTWLAENARHAG
jgi:uncharacterized protein YbjT (DUF2867 family)